MVVVLRLRRTLNGEFLIVRRFGMIEGHVDPLRKGPIPEQMNANHYVDRHGEGEHPQHWPWRVTRHCSTPLELRFAARPLPKPVARGDKRRAERCPCVVVIQLIIRSLEKAGCGWAFKLGKIPPCSSFRRVLLHLREKTVSTPCPSSCSRPIPSVLRSRYTMRIPISRPISEWSLLNQVST